MAENTYLQIIRLSGDVVDADAVMSFSFRKDAYLPYTYLRARAVGVREDISDACEVKFYVSGKLVHHGLIDKMSFETSGGCRSVSVVSRGFTSLLCQNQIEPGLRTGVSINNLMDGFYDLPNVTHEDNSDQSSYIFVKNNSSMWDGIVNLAYKHCGTYPYIRGTNCVRITPVAAPSVFSYTAKQLHSTGNATLCQNLVSHFHMADMSGNFGTYELEDSDVTSKGIVRHKFFELDRQFLYEPQEALAFRDKYATRAFRQRFCTYIGYNGEDLSDTVSFGSAVNERISAVEISGGSGRVVTKLSVYDDKFSSGSI